MNYHLIILSESASFPWGMAAANRVRNLAKSAMMEGWNVTYLSLRGADIKKKEGRTYRAFGQEAGIPYCYPGLFAVRSRNWWIRRLDDFLGCLFTIPFIFMKKMCHKVDAVIIYSRNDNITGLWVIFLHLLRIPVIQEVCEWPLAIAETQGRGHKNAERFCLDILPKVDAALPISTYITNAIAKVAKRKERVIPSFQIPILIDVEGGIIENEKKSDAGFMLYCGSIEYMDIAMIVVDIVHELKNNGIYLTVKFTGKEDDVRLNELKRYAGYKNVLSLFQFTGFLDEEELHRLMRQAICLLAPLPMNPQSESRFSTKIGYCLASATPLVTNAVGDVNLFLKDGVNAFVATDCNIMQFAGKIETIISEPDKAQRIGIAGRELALNKFHYTVASKGFGDFIHKVVKDFKSKEK